VAPGLPVAILEILARRAIGSALGRPPPGGDRARPCPPHHPAGRVPTPCRWGGTPYRTFAFRRHPALRFRLPALAVRRRRDRAGGNTRCVAPQNPGGESPCDL